MIALDTEAKETILSDVKAFLDITWDDTDTDNEVWKMVVSSIRRLDDIAGYELDYTVDEDTEGDDLYLSMSFAAYELMKQRVYYFREKSLDDFELNFVTELNSLFLQGKAYASEEES